MKSCQSVNHINIKKHLKEIFGFLQYNITLCTHLSYSTQFSGRVIEESDSGDGGADGEGGGAGEGAAGHELEGAAPADHGQFEFFYINNACLLGRRLHVLGSFGGYMLNLT